jgi:hypothetical protein
MTEDSASLFDTESLRVAPADPPTPAERAAARHAALAARGLHPLAGPLRTPIRLHPRAAPLADRTAPGLRCGGCVHRQPVHGGSRYYPKCTVGDGPVHRRSRVTHGDATDVRRYWPACTEYRSDKTPTHPPDAPVPRTDVDLDEPDAPVMQPRCIACGAGHPPVAVADISAGRAGCAECGHVPAVYTDLDAYRAALRPALEDIWERAAALTAASVRHHHRPRPRGENR